MHGAIEAVLARLRWLRAQRIWPNGRPSTRSTSARDPDRRGA